MSIAGFAGAGLARQKDGEGAGGLVCGWLPGLRGGTRGQTLQGGDYGTKIVKGIEAVGSAAEFAWGLRAAQKEETEDCGLIAAEIEDGADAVLVFGYAAVADGGDQGLIFKGMEGLANLFLGEIEDGVAAGALIAGVDQGVERERIVLRRGDLFLDKRAQNAKLDGMKLHRYKVPQTRLRWGERVRLDMTLKLHGKDWGLEME